LPAETLISCLRTSRISYYAEELAMDGLITMSSSGEMLRCPACGSSSPVGSRWCPSCGRSFETGQYPDAPRESRVRSKPSRMQRMVYYNVIGRRIAKLVGFIILLMILAGVALILTIF